MKQIQFTKGCPNNCRFCYEPKKVIPLKPYYIPNRKEAIQILDMNFLANPDHISILKSLPRLQYELICGVDWRRMTQEIANLMWQKRFIKIRWAWDYHFTEQKKHKKVWEMFVKAGYRNHDLSVFMIVNWKVPYTECCKKLDLLKVWNVKINDCCWDGGYKKAKPVFWKPEHIKKFRAKCRKHNQLVLFKIDPEYNS